MYNTCSASDQVVISFYNTLVQVEIFFGYVYPFKGMFLFRTQQPLSEAIKKFSKPKLRSQAFDWSEPVI
jgi:hypothetical protein